MGGAADRPPRAGRSSYRCRLRVPLLGRPAVRSRSPRPAIGLRREAATGTRKRLGRSQHRLCAGGVVRHEPGGRVHEAARAVGDRGPAAVSGQRPRCRARLDRRVAGSGARARAGRDASRTGAKVDCRGAGHGGGGLTFGAGSPLPGSGRTVADPLSHRVAHAPGRGAARHHGAHRCRDRAAGRLRLGGGVQPSVQARPRALAQRVACIPRTPTGLRPAGTRAGAAPR